MSVAAGGLSGRVAVVTGAATGIGRATAVHLAELGAAVVVSDRDGDAAEEVAAHMRGDGAEALGVRCDVADADSIAGLVDANDRPLRGHRPSRLQRGVDEPRARHRRRRHRRRHLGPSHPHQHHGARCS